MIPLEKQIEQIITPIIQKQIGGQLKHFMIKEAAKELKKYGVALRNDPRELQSHKRGLLDRMNMRHKIGDIAIGDSQNAVNLAIHGLQARRRRDEINKQMVYDALTKAVRTRFRPE